MVKEVTLGTDQYFKGALKIINCFLGLTKPELDMISYMWSNNIVRLTRGNRDFIKENYGRDKFSINNCFSTLRKKGVLVDINKILSINPSVVKVFEDKELVIRLKAE